MMQVKEFGGPNTIVVVMILCGLCCCCFRNNAGRVGYFLIYWLAAVSLVLNYLLLSKFIAQDGSTFTSADDLWRNIITTNNFNETPAPEPAQRAAVEPITLPNNNNQQTTQFAPWSACLLIKDNNIILPEWLAYHYTMLPLRRVIVAVDPSSKTDPRYILDQYKSIGMNITVWSDDDYWLNGPRAHEQKNFRITNETLPAYAQDRLVYRQKVFYSKCLNQLKREKRTWTAVIDTDEYIAFNYLDETSSEGVPLWCYTKNDFNGYPMEHRRQCEETCSAFNLTCEEPHNIGFHCRIPNCVKQQLRKSFRTKLDQSATAAEHIEKHIDRQFDMYDCIVLARYLFSSRESTTNMVEMDVDGAFNTTLFHTLQHHFRTPLDNAQPGKSIIDVSRYDGSMITSPHRLHEGCLSGGRAFVDNFKMSFRIHHYIGSWESFRMRGLDLFKERNSQPRWVSDDTTPQYTAKEGTRTWLTQFATLVGSKEKALELTERIRVREEREVENSISMN